MNLLLNTVLSGYGGSGATPVVEVVGTPTGSATQGGSLPHTGVALIQALLFGFTLLICGVTLLLLGTGRRGR